MPLRFSPSIASTFSGGSLREIQTKERDEAMRASRTSSGTPSTPESSRAASDSSAISTGTANADFTGTLIASARKLLAVRKKLQVGKPPEYRRGPQQSHASDHQQTDVDSILSHDAFRSASAPVGS